MADGRGVEAGFCVDILRIRSFVTVARLGNVTRASEALHVTQPAVTGHIKTMEQELGVALFHRSPGRIELTRAGAALLPDAEKVLADFNALLGHAKSIKGEVTGSLNFALVDDVEFLRIGNFIQLFDEDRPLSFEALDHIAVVDDLVPHIDGRSVERERAFDRFDRPHDACAEAAGRAKKNLERRLSAGHGLCGHSLPYGPRGLSRRSVLSFGLPAVKLGHGLPRLRLVAYIGCNSLFLRQEKASPSDGGRSAKEALPCRTSR